MFWIATIFCRGRDLIHEAIHITDRAIVRILANGKGATIVVVVDVLLVIEGRGVREDCHADAKQTHMKWRPRGEGTQGRDGGEGEDLETSHECSHARSLAQYSHRGRRRGGEGCDGGGQGMREEEGRCFACRLDRLTYRARLKGFGQVW